MAQKKNIFTIKEAELIQWFSISHKRLDEIIDFFDSDSKDDWDLVVDVDYQIINKNKKLRNFSPKGALKIAAYLDQNEKRGIFYKIKQFLTRHDEKLRKSFARKLIIEELCDSKEIQVYNGRAMIHKQSLRRILETNGSKLKNTVNNLQQRTEQPLELGVDFYEDDKSEFWFSESGVVIISKSMSETLTNKSRREMCKIIEMEFPRAFKEILDDETKRKIEIDNAKKRAKNRDQYTCQITSKKPDKDKSFNLAVHHLYCAQKYPHLATVDTNLITIKEDIHQEFHGTLGGFHQPCTIEDFINFVHTYYPDHEAKLTLKLQKAKKVLEKSAKK
jgi:hypothetical protein